MDDELTERLKGHARSFDSLLSLIPAKLYYSGDVSDQWKRKKQTPEEKRAAKMAKLDPDNWKSAKDIMDERAAAAALKRKREAGEDEDESAESPNRGDGDDLEPTKAVLDAQQPKQKKRKVDVNTKTEPETPEDRRRRKAEERAAKRERKKEKKAKAKEKAERQRAKKREAQGQFNPPSNDTSPAKRKKDAKELQLKTAVDLTTPEGRAEEAAHDDRPHRAESPSTASSEAEEEAEEVFSPQHESGVSSTSSIQPASIDETIKPDEQTNSFPPPTTSTNQVDTSKDPRQRLQEALSQFRAERKADGTDGRPPKNRQELLDQRRRKEEARKAAKKEQRAREKEEEARRQDEEIARRFSPGGSGSLLASPRSPIIGDNNSSNNFTFGRIAFSDGTSLDPSTSDVVDPHKKKGPRDVASQLQLAQAKKARLAGLDEEKRSEIEQKDMWLNAKRRAHGEHVRDDSSLLKKALKRQQGQKKKSEKEWTERMEGVKKAQETKQKKRTENLARRKEEKRAGKGKKVKRPGFEGSFKGRTGGGRKKS
ncbi:60S ribosome biogenesis protein Rrp14 [Cladophialophora carrionii]|uniref:60S ribosome biogenesis protein Rrp14 n=1 Tax=Cladophialophora carrionii TaxID=86049 RepID=A0A1C1CH88_9EURO|nr:60S ribosome biogenesis protein Rrp14 [Cladophialophora carrionii]